MTSKSITLIITVLFIIGAIYYLQSGKTKPSPSSSEGDLITKSDTMTKDQKAKKYEPGKEISSPDGFINTDKIAIQDLVGKQVVLVDFWTYSCINCQRTLPYLNAWQEKYGAKGLTIIGIHTPEFEFEKEYKNVETAVKNYGIKYPVVLDNDYSTWTAYKNRYWPRKYLIDIDGYIVYDHIGEGGYEETEKKIQELLRERSERLGMNETIDTTTAKPENAESVDSSKTYSPEIYFGASRNIYLGNGKSEKTGPQSFQEPTGIKTNILYLTGDWNMTPEYAESTSPKAKVIFRYQAQKVFMVASSENGTKVTILKDGKPVKTIEIKNEQLYRLIEDEEYGEHTLELQIDSGELRTFTFTFG